MQLEEYVLPSVNALFLMFIYQAYESHWNMERSTLFQCISLFLQSGSKDKYYWGSLALLRSQGKYEQEMFMQAMSQ